MQDKPNRYVVRLYQEPKLNSKCIDINDESITINRSNILDYDEHGWVIVRISTTSEETLCSSKNTFNVKQRKKGVSEFIRNSTISAYARNNKNLIEYWEVATQKGWATGSGGDIMWNTNGYDIITTEGLSNNPVYQLLHELCHAYDANFGVMNSNPYRGTPFNKEISMDEWSACMRANCIGSYMGYPMHIIYGGAIDASTKEYIEGTGTRLFDKSGTPFNPF